jgi:hypothetical protein
MESFPRLDASFLSGLDCFDTSERDWKKKVFRALGTFLEPPQVLDRILDLARNELRAKTVLLEPYVSTDWSDEYQAWYSRTFRDIPKRAIRLHFLKSMRSGPLRVEDLFNLSPEYTQKKGSSYVGYCVVRPFEPITVADTVLQSPYEKEASNSVRCTATFETHVLGHQLYVTGMPYIQQDRSVSVCAEANLWMIAKYMHERGEARRFRPSEMERSAISSYGIGSTRDGLTDSQMYNALRLMDIKSDLIEPRNSEDAIRIIYAYVSSEIPVIVAIPGHPGHVFTVIGYTYGNRPNRILSKNDSMAGYVDHFIVHDDERGPYLKFAVGSARAKDRGITQLTMNGEPIESCLVPMPSARINMREEDVRFAVSSLGEYIRTLRQTPTGAPSTMWKDNEFNSLITRVYLRRNDQFKRDIYPPVDDDRRKSDSRLKWRSTYTVALYWRMMLPLYVWVVEFTEPRSIRKNGPYGRELVGEMLLDSTAHADDFRNAILALHFRGRMLYRENPPGTRVVQAAADDRRALKFIDQLDTSEYSPLYRHYF